MLFSALRSSSPLLDLVCTSRDVSFLSLSLPSVVVLMPSTPCSPGITLGWPRGFLNDHYTRPRAYWVLFSQLQLKTMDRPSKVPENSFVPVDDPDCPFCTIAATFGPIDPSTPDHADFNSNKLMPASFVVLSTPHVVAFLDIAPLTRGHVLLMPRKHRWKIGDLSPSEGAEVGSCLVVLLRPDEDSERLNQETVA